MTALAFLKSVMNDPTVDVQLRVEAAIALLPYTHLPATATRPKLKRKPPKLAVVKTMQRE